MAGPVRVIQRLISRYLVVAGLLANLLVAAFLFFWLSNKVVHSEMFRDIRGQILGPLDGVEVTQIVPVASGQINPALRNLPARSWIKIHQQPSDGPETFQRQAHGGAAFDPVRGRVMLFGSDTHGVNWDNTVRFFDMGTLTWSSAYPPDSPETYRVNGNGIPVAGVKGDRPWAMHTFDAVEFDPVTDFLLVASHPEHLNPGKSWGVERNLWAQIKSQPTWAYSVSENRWTPLVIDGVSFFPYGATFDPYRRQLIGVKPSGYWALDIDGAKWKQIGKGAPQVWHNTAAFDIDRATVVSFGSHTLADDVWQYHVGEVQGNRMPTPGLRPPGAGSAPLVYHPPTGQVVALVESTNDSAKSTATWVYSTTLDAWKRVDGAVIPFAIGMNYDMVYDPNHNVMVLVANHPGEPVAVWVLRL